MRKFLAVAVLVLTGVLGSIALAGRNAGGEQLLSHDVYFTLKNKGDADKLVGACHKYLTLHPGTVFFAAGTLAQDLKRDVNVMDFDVALHIVFKDKASHDKYQDAPRHLDFIKENKDSWSKVRVFDSYVTAVAQGSR